MRIVFFLCVCAVFFPLLTGCSGNRSPAILEVDRTEFEFGPKATEPLQAQFMLTNTGGRPLKIVEVLSSCGCATPGFAKAELAPGWSLPLLVRVNRPPIGVRPAKVIVVTDLPNQEKLELEVRAWARDSSPRITKMSPNRVKVIQNNGESGSTLFTIFTLETAESRLVKKVSCESPYVRLEQEKVEEQSIISERYVQRKHIYRIQIAEHAPFGSFTSQLRIELSNGNQRQAPLYLHNHPPISSRPETLFAAASPDEDATPTWNVVILKGGSAPPYDIVSATTKADWLKATIEPYASSSAHKNAANKIPIASLRVEAIRQPEKLPAKAEITVHTNLPHEFPFVIPVVLAAKDETR